MFTITVEPGSVRVKLSDGTRSQYRNLVSVCDYMYQQMARGGKTWVLEYGTSVTLHLFGIMETAPAQEGVLIIGTKEQVYPMLLTHLRMMHAGANDG